MFHIFDMCTRALDICVESADTDRYFVMGIVSFFFFFALG